VPPALIGPVLRPRWDAHPGRNDSAGGPHQFNSLRPARSTHAVCPLPGPRRSQTRSLAGRTRPESNNCRTRLRTATRNASDSVVQQLVAAPLRARDATPGGLEWHFASSHSAHAVRDSALPVSGRPSSIRPTMPLTRPLARSCARQYHDDTSPGRPASLPVALARWPSYFALTIP
jgi:hypothetical protein